MHALSANFENGCTCYSSINYASEYKGTGRGSAKRTYGTCGLAAATTVVAAATAAAAGVRILL